MLRGAYNTRRHSRLKAWGVRVERQSFRAVEEELAPLLAEVARNAERFGLTPELRLRLEMVLEELFLNTVHYGVDDAPDSLVYLSLYRTPDGVLLIYEDHGRAYDPFEAADRAVLAERADERRVGGLGVLLVQGLAQHSRYERVGERNRIELSFAMSQPAR